MNRIKLQLHYSCHVCSSVLKLFWRYTNIRFLHHTHQAVTNSTIDEITIQVCLPGEITSICELYVTHHMVLDYLH